MGIITPVSYTHLDVYKRQNLEGWGGPNPDSWYKQQITLQQRIVKRMREYGFEPVFPGYSGMVPHNAKEKLGLNVSDPGLWCGYHRPAFLQPTDPRFQEIASLYYNCLLYTSRCV